MPPFPTIGTLSEANRRLMEPGDLLESDDDDALLLFETATQLREDAFVIIAHISVQVLIALNLVPSIYAILFEC